MPLAYGIGGLIKVPQGAIQGHGAPPDSFRGELGQMYFDMDTSPFPEGWVFNGVSWETFENQAQEVTTNPPPPSEFGSVALSSLAELETGSAPTGAIVPRANDVYTFVNTYASAGGVPATTVAQGIVYLATNADAVAGVPTHSNEVLVPGNLASVFAAPPAGGIGTTTPRAGSFTTLAASSTLNVTGLSTLGAVTAVGTASINGSGAANTTIGTGGTGAVNIGNAVGNTSVTGGLAVSTTLGVTGLSTIGALTQVGTASINASGTATTTIGGSSGALTLVAGAGNIAINGGGNTIGIGTDANANTIDIGNFTSTTHIAINVGTGSSPDFSLDGTATSKYEIGKSTTTGTILIGGSAMTGAGVITVGSSSAASTVKIAAGSGASTVTIGEGTAGANEVDIINGNIAAVGTVKILCGVGTAGAAGSILQMANNTRVATIDLGNVAPAASRTTTIGGGTVIVAAVTDTLNLGTGGATTNVNSIKTVNVNTGGVTLGQVLTNIATGAVTSGTHTTSIATGARAAGTMTVNLLTGTGTKSFTGGNADGLTTFNFLGPVLVNDSQNSNTSINTGTSTGTVGIGNSLAGAITVASAAAINIDSAVASHFTVTGAAADLTISSVGGSVNVTGTEAAADAIAINASNAAGGIDVNAGTGGIDLDTTGAISIDGVAASNVTVTGAAADLTLSAVGGSVNITASEAAADAILIQASDAAGGVQISAGTGNITQTGKVLKPTNPTFFYNLAASQLNKTGTGTAYTLGTGATLTKIVDYGTNCTTSGVFTAPVTGTYSLSSQVTLTGMTIATTFVISIVTTARTYTNTYTRAAGATDQTCAINVVADMTATDTAHVTIAVTGEGGDTDDIVGSATVQTYFSGFLIG